MTIPIEPPARSRLPWVAAAAVLVAAAVVWGAIAFRATPAGIRAAAVATEGTQTGTTFPEFRLAGLEGGERTLAELRGRVVLVDFWATWCGPCHLQADILKRVYPEARKRGAEFLAVATGEPPDVVRDFLAEKPLPYPVALDPDSRLETELSIYGLPTLVVLDARGRIAYRHTGVIDADTLRQVLARAEAG